MYVSIFLEKTFNMSINEQPNYFFYNYFFYLKEKYKSEVWRSLLTRWNSVTQLGQSNLEEKYHNHLQIVWHLFDCHKPITTSWLWESIRQWILRFIKITTLITTNKMSQAILKWKLDFCHVERLIRCGYTVCLTFVWTLPWDIPYVDS